MASFGSKSTTPPAKPKRGLHEVFKPSVELEAVKGLKMGVYGRPKVGKTHFAMTAPTPIYFIDTEGTARLIAKRFDEARQLEIHIAEVLEEADKSKHKIDLTMSLDALGEAVDLITDAVIASNDPDSPTYEKYGTIVIDSGTDVWEWLGIWLEEKATTKKTNSGDMPRFEWGKANKKYIQMMYMLLRSNWNVIMTFRVKEAMDSQGNSLGWDDPKWQKNTGYWLDMVAEISEDALGPVMRFKGLDRFGKIHADIQNPTWERIVEELGKHAGITLI